jgi:hypothetical protein
MYAFLKRRWVLLSCLAIPLLYSMVDLYSGWYGQTFQCYYGVRKGAIFVDCFPASSERFVWYIGKKTRRHAPNFGTLPDIRIKDGFWIKIPLWLLLSAALGWLVIRELRWREKRVHCAAASE